MAREQRYSPRDEVYLSSTSFEVYVAAGIVFVILFTAGFLAGHLLNYAWLVWPGSFVAILGGYLVINRLEKREQARKRAELDKEYPKREN